MSKVLLERWQRPVEYDVEKLSRRVAHAVHALMAQSRDLRMPPTAAEVCLYDSEAVSVRATAAALREAAKLGLAMNGGGYWYSTTAAGEKRTEFETRFLRETEGA